MRNPAAQLRIDTTTTTSSMPLVEALNLVAAQWSRRLGSERRVVLVSNGGGYRIGPA